ncbi:hypothetical protein [Halogranum rubrum]|nr:hypothetical protein [Halogranum salarium]
MPTFNEYADKSGYFIRAWTPATGNINYKLLPKANAIVEDYGLNPGDEFSWDIIKSLKTLRLLYTDNSGIIGPNEFEPDPNHVLQTSLSKSESHTLLDAIHSHYSLSATELSKICMILGIEATNLQYSLLERVIETAILVPQSSLSIADQVLLQAEASELPRETTLEGGSLNDLHVEVSVLDLRGELEHGRLGIIILLLNTSPDTDELAIVEHRVFLCEDHGISWWYVGMNREITPERHGEAFQQIGYLLPIVSQEVSKAGIKFEEESNETHIEVGHWRKYREKSTGFEQN